MRRRGDYGLDGNMTGLLCMTAATAVLLMIAAMLMRVGFLRAAAVTALGFAVLLTTLGIFLHTSRRGKFLVWATILDSLRLRSDERVLDVGCGRGAVLTMVAQRLARGRAVGIDTWGRADQAGSGIDAAERNLDLESVRERSELVTSDIRTMPFADASFDVIVSSIAIHKIGDRAGRRRAIDEIARVLAPGGRVAITDLAWTRVYAQRLHARGFIGVRRQHLGRRFWWGPAFPATTLLTGTKSTPLYFHSQRNSTMHRAAKPGCAPPF